MNDVPTRETAWPSTVRVSAPVTSPWRVISEAAVSVPSAGVKAPNAGGVVSISKVTVTLVTFPASSVAVTDSS